jgi:predicted dehydrogenase
MQSVPDAELSAVCSLDPVKLAGDLSSVHGNIGASSRRFDFSQVRKYREIGDLLRDNEIEAVDLCLPTHLHAPVAIAAVRAGKHVLVEKPMALDAESAARMIAEASSHGRILMSAHVLRFFPEYQALQNALKSAELGAVRCALFRRRCAAPAWAGWLSDPAQSGGGAFDLLIHDADMCLHLFGKPESIIANGYENLAHGVDLVTALVRFPDGLSVTITGGWHHQGEYPFSMSYTVSADGGTIEYDSAGRPPTLYRPGRDAEALPLETHDGYAAEIGYFLECCRAGRQPAMCPPEESAEAVELMALLIEARKGNGERLSCNL